MMPYRPALVSGTLSAALAVVLGAFGAHALKEVLSPESLNTFETGVRYQIYHSFALLTVGLLYAFWPVKALRMATILFIVGIVLFSGSIYLLVFLKNAGVGLGPVGILTPIGGLFFIAGWLAMALSCRSQTLPSNR